MRKLRVGVLLDSFTVPAWVHSVLEEVAGMPQCELALVVLNGSPRVWVSRWDRLRRFRLRAFDAYEQLDRRIFAHRVAADPFALRDVSALLRDKPLLTVHARPSEAVDRLLPSDVEAIRAHDLDVLLAFGFRRLEGEVLAAAKYGVWALRHGDSQTYRGGPPLYWEMHDGAPVSATMLQVLREPPQPATVIYKSLSFTHPYSLVLNRAATYWKTARFVGRKLRDLYTNGDEAMEPIEAAPPTQKNYDLPTRRQLFTFLVRIASRYLRLELIDNFFYKEWYVAVAQRDPGSGSVTEHHGFRAIESRRGRFYADPCLVAKDDRDYLFFEDYSYRERKGRISYTTLEDPGIMFPVESALAEEFHLAYPDVFECFGGYYMIPESQQARQVRLYRAESFPTGWRLDTVLLDDLSAADATLHWDGHYFWLFAAVAEPGASAQDELFLYYSEDLRGPYLPHPANPIVSDVSRARPAGRLFEHEGVLYRPSRDNSLEKSGAISLQVVDALTPTHYRERLVGKLTPDWLPEAQRTHALALSARWVATDGMRFSFKLRRRFREFPTGVVPILTRDGDPEVEAERRA